MTILLAVGDCFSAFLLGPVVKELRARGVACRVLAVAAPEEMRGLAGVLDDQAKVLPAATPKEALDHALAAVQPDVTCAVTLGASSFCHKLAKVAHKRGVRTLHLDAGVRPFGGHDASEPVAREYCVAGDAERLALVREGKDAASITVVGDLVATSVADAAVPACETHEGLAIAFEHIRYADSDAYGHSSFTLPSAWAPPGWPRVAAPPHDATPTSWIAYIAAAKVLVTDSVGWQRVAVAVGTPCVVLPRFGLWAPGVAAGLVTASDGYDPTTVAAATEAAVQRMSAQPRATPACPTGVASRLADAMLAEVSARTISLPSDADASGRTFTNDEAALVTMVLQRGTLNSTRGTMVTQFERRFAQWLGRKHAIACASGSAAVHCALAALGLQPGDEVITTPITDMGALTPILYEGAVPVFADVDPTTLNVTADTVRAQLTDRTRAIVVTHLFGMPCDLDGILALARDRGLPLIEDAAQAFGACWREHTVGTYGALAAFSLQQGKHITTGEGGIVATDDEVLARRMFLFVNKAWGYGDKQPDHYFPALNYRLTELQGAVALAQLPKLDGVVAARREVAAGLRRELADVAGLHLPGDPPHGTHSWWKFAFRVDAELVPGGASALGRRMQAAGIACVPRYIQKPAFECELFRDWRKSPVTWLPLQHSPRRERAAAMFARADYPGACTGLEQVVVLPINERYTKAHVEYVAGRIRAAVGALQHA
ncbi:MAG: DegT/DnrJ/EryC1/StrS family aminotransferase [Planctomycetota bacterium]